MDEKIRGIISEKLTEIGAVSEKADELKSRDIERLNKVFLSILKG